MADLGRLEKVLDRVSGLPEVEYDYCPAPVLVYKDEDAWSQRSWVTWGSGIITDQGLVDAQGSRCATACCFAGWAVVMFAPPGSVLDGGDGTVTLPGEEGCGEVHDVADYAAQLLDLTPGQRVALFWDAETKEDLAHGVQLIRNGEL